MKTPPLYELPIYWIPVYNQESEAVPPYGVVEIKSISSSTGIASVGKPSSDGSTAVFFNGPTPIPPAGTGQATQTKPAIAAYQADNTDCTQPIHGEEWGAANGSWYLHSDQTGFQVVGEGNYGLCNVIAGPSSADGGYSGTQTVVTDVTWDEGTCEMTKTTEEWTFVNGRLTAVA